MVALLCARSLLLLEAAAGFLQSSTPTAADASPDPDVRKARARRHGAGCCGRPTGVDSGTWPGDSASMLPFMPGTSGTMKSLVRRCVNQVPLCESSAPASHSLNPTPGLRGTNPSSSASAALRSRLLAAGKFSVRPWLNQILANSELYTRSKSPGDPQGQLPGLAKRAKKAEEMSLGAIQTLVRSHRMERLCKRVSEIGQRNGKANERQMAPRKGRQEEEGNSTTAKREATEEFLNEIPVRFHSPVLGS